MPRHAAACRPACTVAPPGCLLHAFVIAAVCYNMGNAHRHCTSYHPSAHDPAVAAPGCCWRRRAALRRRPAGRPCPRLQPAAGHFPRAVTAAQQLQHAVTLQLLAQVREGAACGTRAVSTWSVQAHGKANRCGRKDGPSVQWTSTNAALRGAAASTDHRPTNRHPLSPRSAWQFQRGFRRFMLRGAGRAAAVNYTMPSATNEGLLERAAHEEVAQCISCAACTALLGRSCTAH